MKCWRLALAVPVRLDQKRAAFPCPGRGTGWLCLGVVGVGSERLQGPFRSWNGMALLGLPQVGKDTGLPFEA